MSTLQNADETAAQVSNVLHKAEVRLPSWLASLSRNSRARLAVELILMKNSVDPVVFCKRAFRFDCMVVVSFVLYGGKAALSVDEDTFLRIVLRCTHDATPASESALPQLLDRLLEDHTGTHILTTPRLVRVLPQFRPIYSDMRDALFALANMAASLDNTISDAEQQALNWMTDALPENPEVIASDSNLISICDSIKPSDEHIYDPTKDGQYKPAEVANHQPLEPVQDMLKAVEEIKGLVGLLPVKEELQRFMNLVRISKAREKQGLTPIITNMLMVFSGNPGTGKTTVAVLVGRILRGLSMLNKGHVVKVDRSLLVSEFVGQTAPKILAACKRALDGILYIDEAYSLSTGNSQDNGNEAIDILLKFMEDNRDRMAIILAGNTGRMKEFIGQNPGLQSRFNRYVEFPDYSPDELMQIYHRLVATKGYILDPQADALVGNVFATLHAAKLEKFENARMVHSFFERTISIQADRLASAQAEPNKQQLVTLVKEDLPIHDFAPHLAQTLSDEQSAGDQDQVLGEIRLI